MMKTIKKIMNPKSSGFREGFQICFAASSLNRTQYTAEVESVEVEGSSSMQRDDKINGPRTGQPVCI